MNSSEATPPAVSPVKADAALMKRVAAGDQAAARLVVDRHLRGAVSFAWRMLSDHAAAEDVAQDAFLKLWRQAPRWQPRAQIGTWLRTVLYNGCIDAIRRRKPQSDVSDMELADGRPGPAADHQSRQVAGLVRAAMAELPERQRAAIALVHYEECSNIEAAEILEVSVDAVESLLARGRRALRDALQDQKADLLGEPE